MRNLDRCDGCLRVRERRVVRRRDRARSGHAPRGHEPERRCGTGFGVASPASASHLQGGYFTAHVTADGHLQGTLTYLEVYTCPSGIGSQKALNITITSPTGELVVLTTGEFDMLVTLARHPGRVMTRETLMELTRGRSYDAFDRTIDAQIARLRKKIEADPAEPRLIKSVRGVGYVFAGRTAG